MTKRAPRWSRRWVLAIAVLGMSACAKSGPRSPARLRTATVDALASDQPDRAYDLLAPEVQATVSRAEFRKRWKKQRTEHKGLVTRSKKSGASREAIRAGTTVHDGGRVLKWSVAGGQYYVVDGLPGLAQTSTPAQTVRAFIAAVRATDLGGIRVLLGDELATTVAEDWKARVDALEESLAEPGAVELSGDLQRAELRYGTGRVMTLEQTPRGWRITRLE